MTDPDGAAAAATATAFGHEVAAALGSTFADELVGVYFVGSMALGGYVPGESDIDMVAVCLSPVAESTKNAMAERIWDVTANCPARGLEFTLYRAEVVSSPAAKEAGFEVNINGGPRMPRSLHLSCQDEPPFWYVLDRAIAHRHGIAISGPPPAETFHDVARPMLLDVMGDSMRWHRKYEKATLYSVLNACRAWRFAAEDVLGSKLAGAQWARPRWGAPEVIDAAVDLRHGRPAQLDAGEVDRFLDHVEGVLGRAEA